MTACGAGAAARYYQDLFSDKTPDLSALRAAAEHSSWACLILGDLAGTEAEKLAFYRMGAAMGPAAEGEESMAAVCRRRQEELARQKEQARQAEAARREEARRDEAARQAEAERAAEEARHREERKEHFAWWEGSFRAGDYETALSTALQASLEEGNPFAALVLARRYAASRSPKDRAQTGAVLQQARALAEQYYEEDQTPATLALLVDVLQRQGRWHAADGPEKDLEKACACFLRACKLDPNAREGLLWFYDGPAREMKRFADAPGELEKRRLELQECAAREGGIAPRIRFALYCHDKKHHVKAKDWLNLALTAPDAAAQPALCAVARFYLARYNRQTPDLTALAQAAEAGSSWACLLLAEQKKDEAERLALYEKGAAADPRAEGAASQAEACARQRDAIYQRRAAARNEALNRKKQARDAAARQAEAERLNKLQQSWLTFFCIAFAATMAVFLILNLVASSTGSALLLTLAWALAYAWIFGAAGALAATFAGFCPAIYKGQTAKLRITLTVALLLAVMVPSALNTLL